VNTCFVCPLQTQKKPGKFRGKVGDPRAAFLALQAEAAELVERVELLLGLADELHRMAAVGEFDARRAAAGRGGEE
jgi:hypothetical protein